MWFLKMDKRNRIEWLDTAKGIGIILIVLGHCLPLESFPCQIIFTFHVPLFFLLSGYVFKSKYSFNAVLKKKFHAVLIPFFQAFVLGLIVSLAVPVWRAELSVSKVLQDLFLGNPENVHNSSIWFLLCLFWTYVCFCLIQKTTLPVQLLLLSGIYVLDCLFIRFFPGKRLPFCLDCVPLALVFFSAGFYLKENDIFGFQKKKLLKSILLFVASSVLVFIIYRFNGSMNLHGLTIGNPVLYILAGVSGSLAVVAFSMIVSLYFRVTKAVLLWFGRHSLIIMCTQSILIRLYIVGCERFFSEKLTLYSFNYKHAVICFALVCFLCEPLICVLSDAVRKKIEKRLKAGLKHE